MTQDWRRVASDWRGRLIPGSCYDVYTPITVHKHDAELKLNGYVYVGYTLVTIEGVGEVPHFEFRKSITELPITISGENLCPDSSFDEVPARFINCSEVNEHG